MVRTFSARVGRVIRSGWLRLGTTCRSISLRVSAVVSGAGSLAREEGQTTAEYALVILAAAAVALVLTAWAKSTGKLPEFFDKVIDDLINSF
jgi:Flp pilus assembly pilin Flp